jgi:hypothetical protein
VDSSRTFIFIFFKGQKQRDIKTAKICQSYSGKFLLLLLASLLNVAGFSTAAAISC